MFYLVIFCVVVQLTLIFQSQIEKKTFQMRVKRGVTWVDLLLADDNESEKKKKVHCCGNVHLFLFLLAAAH